MLPRTCVHDHWATPGGRELIREDGPRQGQGRGDDPPEVEEECERRRDGEEASRAREPDAAVSSPGEQRADGEPGEHEEEVGRVDEHEAEQEGPEGEDERMRPVADLGGAQHEASEEPGGDHRAQRDGIEPGDQVVGVEGREDAGQRRRERRADEAAGEKHDRRGRAREEEGQPQPLKGNLAEPQLVEGSQPLESREAARSRSPARPRRCRSGSNAIGSRRKARQAVRDPRTQGRCPGETRSALRSRPGATALHMRRSPSARASVAQRARACDEPDRKLAVQRMS